MEKKRKEKRESIEDFFTFTLYGAHVAQTEGTWKPNVKIVFSHLEVSFLRFPPNSDIAC